MLGAAVVLDSDMMVGSQAGNAPNDVAGLFFLTGGASRSWSTARRPPTRAGRPARASRAARRRHRGPGPIPRRPASIQTGVVEDVPVEGDPRALATDRRRPALPGRARRRPRDRDQDHAAGRARGAHDRDRRSSAGRRHWLAALGVWLGGMRDHRGLLVRAQPRLRPQPVPPDRQARADQPSRPGPGRPLPARAPQLSEYYNDPHVWKDKFFPVLARPARTALAGDPGGRRSSASSGRSVKGGSRADADAGRSPASSPGSPTSSRR